MVNGAWMLDGATKDRVYALSLASRYGVRFKLTLFKLGRLPRTVRLGLEGPAGLTTRLMATADHRE
ncbi:hypothetical protein PIB30_044607 [Stylosanthes scabra]|uniref:Uncharacterized protein n=1 Tax=Stylosanthes scabra TaxID=79078 RepID=A0ABU6SFY6_9FABA|nr:hypothetical protein [Stylosanthes scabra]